MLLGQSACVYACYQYITLTDYTTVHKCYKGRTKKSISMEKNWK